MTARPRVSVVVPAWNAERFLGETIESVRAQTFADWELIVADDGSDDGTAALVERFAAADPRIRVLRLARTGLAAAARNAGVTASRGELVALLDADDLWTPDKLAKQAAWLDAHPKAAAVTSWHEVFGDPARAAEWSRMIWRDTTPFVTTHQIIAYTPATPSLMVRRPVWDALGGMRTTGKLKTGEDREFIVRLVLSHPVGRIAEPLVRVRVHPIGASLSTADIDRRREREWELYRSLCRSGLLDRRLKKRFKASFYYNQSRDALFTLGGPFRRDLYRALATGQAPAKAWVMAALAAAPRADPRPPGAAAPQESCTAREDKLSAAYFFRNSSTAFFTSVPSRTLIASIPSLSLKFGMRGPVYSLAGEDDASCMSLGSEPESRCSVLESEGRNLTFPSARPTARISDTMLILRATAQGLMSFEYPLLRAFISSAVMLDRS